MSNVERRELGLKRLFATRNGGRDWQAKWIAENSKPEWSRTQSLQLAHKAWVVERARQESEWRELMRELDRQLKTGAGA